MAEREPLDRASPLTETPSSNGEKKAERKRLKQLEDSLETGRLDPWERYRILTDLLDHYQDVAEMADRKSRFALVVLGAVNALNLLVVARPDVVSGGRGLPTFIGVYVIAYLGLSLYLFAQAVSALKPRIETVLSRVTTPDGSSQPIVGLRFVPNILEPSFDEYYDKWKQAQFSDVNRELALHVRQLAAIVTAKYRTLHRLYSGLMVLVFLTAGLITLLVYARLLR